MQVSPLTSQHHRLISMVSLCTNSPLPTFNSLYDGFVENLTFPPQSFTFPSLPSLPSPMFPSIGIPNLEAVKILVELQSMQLMTTAMGMIQPMIDFLGLDLGAVLPKIPYLDISLTDLLNGDPSVFIQSIKDRLATGLPNLAWPFIPDPFYFKLGIPDISAIQTASLLVKDYSNLLTGFISGLVSQVTSELEIANMPTLPAIPTYGELVQLLLDNVPGASNVLDIIESGVSLSDIFNISIPGIPPLPSIPSPLIPSVNIPEFDFQEGMGLMLSNITTVLMQKIMDFIDSTLGAFLPFSFPTICLPF